jgi:hypothetical protein
MSRAATTDRRLIVLLLAACLAAVGVTVSAGAPAQADASTLYTLLNQSRQQAGLPLLARDSRLDTVAQAWTSKMASSGTLSHNPSYSTQIPSGWTRAGENVGFNYSDANLHAAWMASSGHKANVLGSYTSVGIGWVKDSSGRVWGTHVFATYAGVKPPATIAATSTTLTDVTGDVRTDLVGVNSSGRLVIVPGNGTGGLRTSMVMGSGWSGMRDLFPVADATRDGVSDLYARDTSGRLYLYQGARGGGLGSATLKGTGWSGMNMIVDLDGNGDGVSDLYARDAYGRLWLYSGDGAGNLRKGVQVGSGWGKMTALVSPGDINRDGRSDLFARDSSGYLHLFLGDGRGGFSAGQTVGKGWSSLTVVAPGDLTGDRIGDLVGRTSGGAFVLYPGNGTGGFRTSVNLGTTWSGLNKLG